MHPNYKKDFQGTQPRSKEKEVRSVDYEEPNELLLQVNVDDSVQSVLTGHSEDAGSLYEVTVVRPPEICFTSADAKRRHMHAIKAAVERRRQETRRELERKWRELSQAKQDTASLDTCGLNTSSRSREMQADSIDSQNILVPHSPMIMTVTQPIVCAQTTVSVPTEAPLQQQCPASPPKNSPSQSPLAKPCAKTCPPTCRPCRRGASPASSSRTTTAGVCPTKLSAKPSSTTLKSIRYARDDVSKRTSKASCMQTSDSRKNLQGCPLDGDKRTLPAGNDYQLDIKMYESTVEVKSKTDHSELTYRKTEKKKSSHFVQHEFSDDAGVPAKKSVVSKKSCTTLKSNKSCEQTKESSRPVSEISCDKIDGEEKEEYINEVIKKKSSFHMVSQKSSVKSLRTQKSEHMIQSLSKTCAVAKDPLKGSTKEPCSMLSWKSNEATKSLSKVTDQLKSLLASRLPPRLQELFLQLLILVEELLQEVYNDLDGNGYSCSKKPSVITDTRSLETKKECSVQKSVSRESVPKTDLLPQQSQIMRHVEQTYKAIDEEISTNKYSLKEVEIRESLLEIKQNMASAQCSMEKVECPEATRAPLWTEDVCVYRYPDREDLLCQKDSCPAPCPSYSSTYKTPCPGAGNPNCPGYKEACGLNQCCPYDT